MRFRAVYGLVVVSGLFAGAALAAFDGAADVGAGRGPDVIINELMVNPHRTYDSRGEWIELYNRGDEPAHLEGWTIGDEIYDDIVLPSIVIEPGGFALLARNGDTFRNGGVAADYVYGNSIILWNSDDLLVLRDADGMERDVVDYRTDRIHGPRRPLDGARRPGARQRRRRELVRLDHGHGAWRPR